MKSGFIAILGRPNAGKSSLVNALVGEKVSIVSPKAQTTRSRVMGIFTDGEYQMVFIDTPGIHSGKTELDAHMEKCVVDAAKDVDAYVYVIDATKRTWEKEKENICKYLGKAPLYVVVNKVDLCGFESVYPLLQFLSPMADADYVNPKTRVPCRIEQIITTSCVSGKNIDLLKTYLKTHLNDENQYFESDQISDKPISFMIAEIIREKALWLLSDEIPHGVGVSVTNTDFSKKTAIIRADIILDQDSHKQIVIGENGSMLKEIGTRARQDIERLIQKDAYLELFVKVRKGWRNKNSIIKEVT